MPEPAIPSSTSFVGRETELRQLHQALKLVIGRRQPQLVLVQGDFGVGKTALVEHFLAEAIQNLPMLVGQVKCREETQGSGLLPFSDLLVSLTNQSVQQGSRVDLLELVQEVAPGWIEIVGERISTQKHLARLRQNLVDYFNDEQLRTLCFDLEIDYENLPAQAKAGKAKELVAELERTSRTSELVEICSRLRPHVSWNDILKAYPQASHSPKRPAPKHLAALRQSLVDYFSDEELRSLCFDLGIDYENLPAQAKAGKARELVVELERAGRVSELVEICSRLRPSVSWGNIPEAAPKAFHPPEEPAQADAESGKMLVHSVRQAHIFAQFANALAQLAEKQPIIAILDDLQWADVSSLQLLSYLASSLENRAVLFVCAYRPVEANTGPDAKLFRKILANLPGDSATKLSLTKGIKVAEYVARRYPLNAFDRKLITRVQKVTEGHALFVAHLFSWWEQRGIITLSASDGHSQWRVAKKATPVIPPKIGDLLDVRLESMAKELQDVLAYASVEGEDFTAQAVARLCRLEELEASDDLEKLADLYRLIQEQQTP